MKTKRTKIRNNVTAAQATTIASSAHCCDSTADVPTSTQFAGGWLPRPVHPSLTKLSWAIEAEDAGGSQDQSHLTRTGTKSTNINAQGRMRKNNGRTVRTLKQS